MNKKLNESSLRSELSSSAFFESPDTPSAEVATPRRAKPKPQSETATRQDEAQTSGLDEIPQEDINVTPHISQSLRFTEAELRWLRQQSYRLTDSFGGKISQSTVVRIALHQLWTACNTDKDNNPLLEAISRLKK